MLGKEWGMDTVIFCHPVFNLREKLFTELKCIWPMPNTPSCKVITRYDIKAFTF